MSLTSTTFLLMAEFNSPTIRLDDICEKFLGLTPARAKALAARAELDLPTFRIAASQKAPVMVHVEDLAALIDRRQTEARAIHDQVNSTDANPPA